MAWLVATLSLIVIWVASIFKVFFGATSSSKAAVLDDGNKKNVLFVIAHPDDESMFFSPTINYLASSGYNLHMLCFSTGNADGMGSIRKDELHQACAVLRVPLEQLKVLDHPNLQDGFGQVWSHDLLAKVIGEEVSNHDIHTIITFDNYGVSGHCNHRDVHHGVLKFLQTNSERNIKAWELASLNIFRKYSGPIDIWLSIFSSKRNPSKAIIINEQPWKSYKAMAQHLSQWVWFRKLFVSFSSYTYANTLDRINT
ncbi:PREDICTED: probable N-acetylglucosaminyl-phosphatidylinositol de-N-acetylase isoform X2 [Brassica oleracea var. oleracea]|uniref:probable N-acetylglucosaminyl-phosphatidylinositol de-N-acetylase isoform X2 n=1 Tax=Brassica oleracea var. oleracea TaxID=109376 RepID=UPI0006A6C251|nr:PREDICTED: probable N-acetylglucosaminyl-phosphatidylinositol de-N-acetylase isoform X2 [Brassica oleracea var. oleracea]